jgi:predicted RNase H-like nuclease (RuvC/YqgF family)
MKKISLFLLILPLFFACGPSAEELKLQATVDSLQKVTGADSETINEYMKSFNEIQNNLDQIKEKEKIISTRTSGDVELNQTDKDRINEDITSIYQMMIDNKNKLAYLKKKLKNSDTKVAEFQKTITRLTEEMNQKESQLADLKATLEKKDFDIAALNEKITTMNENVENLESETNQKTETINEQDKKLHTAHYVVGKKKELQEKGVITTEGGFIGIGGVQKISETTSGFTDIDIREVKEISLGGTSKAMLLTDHPKDSYELVEENGKVTTLIIKDYENFWKLSKFLVVIVK